MNVLGLRRDLGHGHQRVRRRELLCRPALRCRLLHPVRVQPQRRDRQQPGCLLRLLAVSRDRRRRAD